MKNVLLIIFGMFLCSMSFPKKFNSIDTQDRKSTFVFNSYSGYYSPDVGVVKYRFDYWQERNMLTIVYKSYDGYYQGTCKYHIVDDKLIGEYCNHTIIILSENRDSKQLPPS